MRPIPARPGALIAAVAALLLTALALIAVPTARAQPPVRNGSALAMTFDIRASLTITPRDAAGCGGEPCLDVVDTAVPVQPAGACGALSATVLALRCSTAGVATTEIVAGPDSSVSMLIDRPGGSPCPDYAVALRQDGGLGQVISTDGCPQQIVCSPTFRGTVFAGNEDVVADACETVNVDGVQLRKAPESCTPPLMRDCVPEDHGGGGRYVGTTPPGPPPGAGGGGSGGANAHPNPITAVRAARSGRRAVRGTVVLSTPALITVTLTRRTARGWTNVASVSRRAAKGTTRVTLRRPGGRRLAPGRYRLETSAAVQDSKLVVSKAVRLRR
ncbi:hypothetical protein [Patulibacter sp. SYSU D01012]|uniref:hypothetical protein n=1 Tax=Patulibacter sp. SYSU D01012 TaxID=2817381 RepID=UPI001B315DB7|nr:hypothetical protein [Patulibacter sp. SYSU D01012]